MTLNAAPFGTLAAAIGLGLTSQQCVGASWEETDDFSGSLAKWDSTYAHVNNPNDGLFLNGGHLQLIKTLTSTTSASGALIWPQSLPLNTNWVITIDAHVNPSISYNPLVEDQDVQLQLRLYNTYPSAETPTGVRIGFWTEGLGNRISIAGSDPTTILGTDITLGISYDSDSKQVTTFYHQLNDASSIVLMETTQVATWSQIQLALLGYSRYWRVDSGAVWFDNFRVTGTSTSVSIGKSVRLSFNGLALGRSYQLQVSSTLTTWTNQGAWFTATNLNMVYPQYWDVDNWGSLYFRLQMAP